MSFVGSVLNTAALATAAAAAAVSAAGLGGSRNGWLDVVNNFAPFILVMGLAGVAFGYLSPPGAIRALTPWLSLIAVAYGGARLGPEWLARRGPAAAAGARIRILSANLWRDNPSPHAAVEALLACDADAVLLQEASGAVRPSLDRLKTRYPYSRHVAGSDVQIFAKSPITASGGEIAGGYRGAFDWVWIMTTTQEGEAVTLATTHFTWPFPPGPQSRQRRSLSAVLGQMPTADLILTGDFNTTPWSFGMKDQDRLLAPLTRRTRAWFSWPARLKWLGRRWPMPILPIDHIYAGPGWATLSLARIRVPGSDHFATEAVFVRHG